MPLYTVAFPNACLVSSAVRTIAPLPRLTIAGLPPLAMYALPLSEISSGPISLTSAMPPGAYFVPSAKGIGMATLPNFGIDPLVVMLNEIVYGP